MKTLIPFTLAAVLVAGPALAGSAEAPLTEAPVTVPSAAALAGTDWTGPYVGASLGFARTTWRGGNGRERSTDAAGALHAGYNMDMGAWVAGGEVLVAPGFEQTIGTREIRWGAAARLRAGPKFGPGGNSWGFASLGLSHIDHKAIEDGGGSSSNAWIVGIGAAHMLQENVFVSGELSHGRFTGNSNMRSTGVSMGVSFRF